MRLWRRYWSPRRPRLIFLVPLGIFIALAAVFLIRLESAWRRRLVLALTLVGAAWLAWVILAPAVAEHPEAWYVHVYDMDSYEEVDVLDYRAPPTRLDSLSHCGYNVDFKLFYDRVSGRLFETNFSDVRGMFYNLEAGTVEEQPVGSMRDVYGFESLIPDELYNRDRDDDGIVDHDDKVPVVQSHYFTSKARNFRRISREWLGLAAIDGIEGFGEGRLRQGPRIQ